MEDIHDLFTEDNYRPRYQEWLPYAKNKWNTKASFMNTLLCDMENQILHSIKDYYGNPENCVMCHDGLMILHDLFNNPKYTLEGCEQFITKKLEISVKLKVKEMDETLTIPDNLPEFTDDRYDEFTTYNTFVGKNVSKEVVDHWFKENMKIIDAGGRS